MSPADDAAAVLEKHHLAEGSPKPYHHGDLSRALVLAGREILETQGPAALSLRAVAREAGVSPAAPYHHFKDKGELLLAVAREGWMELGDAIKASRARAASPAEEMTEIGVAYVCFAREHPALYRIMYDQACDRETMLEGSEKEGSGWRHVTEALISAGYDPNAAKDIELATISAWCMAHGLAEMTAFREFDALKAELGGEVAFIRAVLKHGGTYVPRKHD